MDPTTRSAPASPSSPDGLDRRTCHALLAQAPIGRIVFTEGALPAVELVGFELDGDDVLIDASPGTRLADAARATVVAFEVDEYDPATGTGWCVVLIGRSYVGEQAIRITPEIVRGRRIRPVLSTARRDTAVG